MLWCPWVSVKVGITLSGKIDVAGQFYIAIGASVCPSCLWIPLLFSLSTLRQPVERGDPVRCVGFHEEHVTVNLYCNVQMFC